MKLQGHIPTVTVGARGWRAPMIALISLAGASILVLTLQSVILLNNPLFARLRTSLVAPGHISLAHRVSLDRHLLSHPIDPSRRFSVAHPLPANVAASQPFSIGVSERLAFEVFGQAALRDLLSDERMERQLKPRKNRMLLMLMWLRLHTQRS
ncbi:MAG: hypothetical protein ACREQH_00080 [Candidatus Binatus sp.]